MAAANSRLTGTHPRGKSVTICCLFLITSAACTDAQDIPGYKTYAGFDLNANQDNLVKLLAAANRLDNSTLCGAGNGILYSAIDCAPQCNFFAADGCTAFVHDSALNLRSGIVEEPGCCFLKSSNATYTLLVKDAYDAFVINRLAPESYLAPSPAPSPVTEPETNSVPIRAIVLATIGALAALLLGLLLFCCWQRRRRQDDCEVGFVSMSKAELKEAVTPSYKSKAGGIATGVEEFRFEELEEATLGWDSTMMIGEGGYGKVYRGTVKTKSGLQMVAIKRGGQNSRQGEREFLQEIAAMSKIRHKHLVQLIGFSEAENERCLVYEYMMNGTVQEHLWGRASTRAARTELLTWPKRVQIAIGAAKGLEYLHTAVEPPIIHRDVKLTNILLDDNLQAKVADFGISRMDEARNGSTIVKGTLGYLDPHYMASNELTTASDVYSFGMFLLELVTGRPVISKSKEGEPQSLLQWAMPYMQTKRSVEIADPRMDGGYNIPSLQLFCALATTCLHGDPPRRPTMSEVRHTLEQIGKHAVSGVNALTAHADGPKLGLAITPDWDLMSTLSTSETWGELRSNSSDSGLQDEYSEGGLGSKERPSALSSLGSSAWSGPITMLQPR